jgi:hypothetical protein
LNTALNAAKSAATNNGYPVTASKTLRSSRAQCRRARIGYEIQDHVRDLCGIVTKPGKMVSSIKFNELRAWNVFRQETATLDADGRILGPVQNQGRHADRRQDAGNIDFTIHSHQALDRRILSNFWKLCGNPSPSAGPLKLPQADREMG